MYNYIVGTMLIKRQCEGLSKMCWVSPLLFADTYDLIIVLSLLLWILQPLPLKNVV